MQDRTRVTAVMMERFEEWIAREGIEAPLDQVFVSEHNLPENPYENPGTGLMFSAWMASMWQSTNYVADDPVRARTFTFHNGRKVSIGDDGFLCIESVNPVRLSEEGT